MGNTDFYFYFFAIVGILLIVVMPIQWITNFYFGLSGGVLSTIVLSTSMGLLYLFFFQFGQAMASTGNVHAPRSELLLIFGSAFLISIAITAVSNFGVYYLVQYYKTGILNKLAFFSWLLVAIGGPLGYIGTKEFSAWWATSTHERHFTPVFFSIYTYPELAITIEELKFINTSDGRESTIQLRQHDQFDWKGEAGNGRSLWEVFSQKIDIPKGADKFVMSWYSLVEDKYYSDEFPFPYERFSLMKFPVGTKEMEPLSLHIKPEGKVDLFGSYHRLLFYYKDVATKPTSEKEKNEKLAAFISQNMLKVSAEALVSGLQEIKTSGRLQQRIEMEEKAFTWSMDLDGPGKVSTIWLKDFRYQDYKVAYQWLNSTSKRPLPANLSLYFNMEDEESGFWATFTPDVEKLYEIVLALTGGDEEIPVKFSFTIKDRLESEMEFLVASDTERVIFTNWQVKID